MDLVKDSAVLRKKIEKINRTLTGGTALSEDQIAELKDKCHELIHQFKALVKKL